MKIAIEKFKQGETLYFNKKYEESMPYYEQSYQLGLIGPAGYRLGMIYNIIGEYEKSYRFHLKAIESYPQLIKSITTEEHPQRNYLYTHIEEIEVLNCPICGKEGNLAGVYNSVADPGFVNGFHPIKRWRKCEDCHHIYTASYPKDIINVLTNSAPNHHLSPDINVIPLIATIYEKIIQYAKGKRLLEVGVGAGESLAIAKEFQFEVEGLDIRPIYAELVEKLVDVPVYVKDFNTFKSDKKYDVLIFGDILEHVLDPKQALESCYNLLEFGGVIHLSTPNFESAFSILTKQDDPMWRVCEHINYFSYQSLITMMKKIGFEIKHYSPSRRYNGSMEIIAVK
jgi:2-polyprenyl-3-methyl-5-hydroxy-6-metoxy-1,4-benzoquinol methylase